MTRPNQNSVWVTAARCPKFAITTDAKNMQISFFWKNGDRGITMRVSRKDARLLATRVNQCLDATAKK